MKAGGEMTTDSNDRNTREGVRIDIPFFTFRLGGSAWEARGFDDDSAYGKARRRVRARLGLYRHAATYFAVIVAIVFLDLVTDGELSSLVLWFAAIWGAFLIWHAFNVFVFPAVWSQETEERMIEEELRRQRGDTNATEVQ
jgi:2TM domain